MKRIKILVSLIFVAGVVASLAGRTLAYPPFLTKARKFGAKDCTFCHLNPEGGEGWNERGQWLIKEKDRRGADVVDVEWLADYKPGGSQSRPSASPPAPAGPVAEFVKLEQQWMGAVAAHDGETLRRLTADEFTLTSAYSTGELTNRDQFLKNALEGVHGMEFSFHEAAVNIYGDVAVFKCKMNSKYTLNGEDRTGDYMVTDVWVKRDGRWQVVSRHSSLPMKPAAK